MKLSEPRGARAWLGPRGEHNSYFKVWAALCGPRCHEVAAIDDELRAARARLGARSEKK